MIDLQPDVQTAVDAIRNVFGDNIPDRCLILGSGLSAVAERGETRAVLPYRDIPGLPVSTVSGHAGELRIVGFAGHEYLTFCGRAHLYEGHPAHRLGMNVRIASALGCKTVIPACAVGSLDLDKPGGSIVLIQDHINFTGNNPLIGVKPGPGESRFPDTSALYPERLISAVEKIALEERIVIRRGIYAWVTGPSYESPAESRMMKHLGAGVVGMSLLPESLTAAALRMDVLAFGCVTNFAPGIGDEPPTHDAVLTAAKYLIDPIVKILSRMEYQPQ